MIRQAYYLPNSNKQSMQISIGLLLVLGVCVIFGVFVIADNVTKGSGGSLPVQEIPDGENSSIQADLLVRFNPELWNTFAMKVAANASHTYIGSTVETDYTDLGLAGLQLVKLPPGMTVKEGVSYYQALPYVQYAEPNAVYSIESTSNSTAAQPASLSAVSDNLTSHNSRLLVQFKVQAFPDRQNLSVYANQTHASLNATLVKDFTADGLAGLHLIELPSKIGVQEGIGFYKNQSSVLFVEPDYPVSITTPKKKV